MDLGQAIEEVIAEKDSRNGYQKKERLQVDRKLSFLFLNTPYTHGHI